MTTYWTTDRPTKTGRYWYRDILRGIDPHTVYCVANMSEAWGGPDEWVRDETVNMLGGEWSKHAIPDDGSAVLCVEEQDYGQLLFPLL